MHSDKPITNTAHLIRLIYPELPKTLNWFGYPIVGKGFKESTAKE